MKFLSLFTGIGGFDLGLERAGMTCVGQVEIDPFCRRVLARQWPLVWKHDDVKTLTRELVETNCGQVDLICGGPPCQPVSREGLRLGHLDDRWLWPAFIRLVFELRPRYVLMENPTGLLDGFLGGILGSLAGGGFDAEWFCLSAAQFGFPHFRNRVFVVAYPEVHGRAGPICCDAANGAGESWTQHRRNKLQSALDTRRALVEGLEQRLGEPAIFGSNDGIAARVVKAELGAAGNAVVPQVAEWVGRRMMEVCL